MIGKRKTETTLFDVGNVWPFAPKPDSFHGQLARVSDSLFFDDDFAALYSQHRGRPSTPPSLLALVLLLQNYEGISDEESIDRTACDLRWAAVLRRPAGTPLCAKSTLQLFRAHLLLHEGHKLLLQRSLAKAREKGLLKGQHLTAAADTKPILGRGAVLDTYNLLATAMQRLARAIAHDRQEPPRVFLERHGFATFASGAKAPSFKGSVDIDWSDEVAREKVLTDLVQEARRLMAMADGSNAQVKQSADLLEQLLLQDVEETPSDKGRPRVRIKQGTTPGRTPSVTDPEQRHGRKSASKRFTGSKASVAVDTQSGLFLATAVLAGDAADATDVLPLIQEAEVNSGATVAETIGDCAYGSGGTRQEFVEAGRELIAKVPSPARNGTLYPKSAFKIVLPVVGEPLSMAEVTCPGGNVAHRVSEQKDGGAIFYFDEFCGGCSRRDRCTDSKDGRSLHVHAQEALLQAAREYQSTVAGRAKLRERLIVENGLARLAALGIGQARYLGREKTRLQLSLAATVANFRRLWRWSAESKGASGDGCACLA